ncbi:MAG TPA: dihydrolipoamide acetyltransferase family protein [Gemmatimonadaceae bacterium]|nr:dihydrolipoamide acetyltransferase family protein [Gemmatimonadaceae bacterium]
MPSLGADMEYGTLVEWRVNVGDRVRRGQIIAEVETEKGVFEVEVLADGMVDELLVTPGTKARVSEVLARLRADGTAAAPSPPRPSPSPALAEVPPPPQPTPIPVPAAPPAAPAARPPRASPLARRIAAERGVDLTKVQGTGADGTITKADVERVIAGAPSPTAPTVPPVPAPTEEGKRAMRRAVAAAVTRSKREIPHYYLSADIDVGRALAWLAEVNRGRPVAERILPAALLLKSIALALRKFPDLNGFWLDGELRSRPEIHVGVVISIRTGGLIAPAIHDVDRRPVADVMQALRDLVRRAREGGLRGSEMTDATISVSNLGDEGVQTVFGVIYPPQVALVGLGRIGDRPWADQGMLDVRPVVTATLAADHRATDGHYGALFLREIERLLQHPEAL